jgi:hypothetical protein
MGSANISPRDQVEHAPASAVIMTVRTGEFLRSTGGRAHQMISAVANQKALTNRYSLSRAAAALPFTQAGPRAGRTPKPSPRRSDSGEQGGSELPQTLTTFVACGGHPSLLSQAPLAADHDAGALLEAGSLSGSSESTQRPPRGGSHSGTSQGQALPGLVARECARVRSVLAVHDIEACETRAPITSLPLR